MRQPYSIPSGGDPDLSVPERNCIEAGRTGSRPGASSHCRAEISCRGAQRDPCEATKWPTRQRIRTFLTADFALVRSDSGELVPELVEIQAFPSVFAYQAELCSAYREAFDLPQSLGVFLGGLDEAVLLESASTHQSSALTARKTSSSPELDPLHQKTFPDFHVTIAAPGNPGGRHCVARAGWQ